jgi:hypothetical protein
MAEPALTAVGTGRVFFTITAFVVTMQYQQRSPRLHPELPAKDILEHLRLALNAPALILPRLL